MVAVDTIPAVYAKLENRPGTLERLARILGERKVNIDAVSLETVGSTGFARVVTPKARDVAEALRGQQFEAYESSLVVAAIPNKPGELGRAARELAAARINVESVLTTPDGRLAFRTSDPEHTAQILRKL